MVIQKINTDEVENILKNIDEKSVQIKMLQESLDRVNENLKLNEKDFKVGKISMEIYRDIKTNLEKEMKPLEIKIDKIKEEIKVILASLSEIMNKNKI
jgi:septal ring factor EnvC (AmiA/AmiB activator)